MSDAPDSARSDSAELGERLAAHRAGLLLLVQHLAGPAVRARVEPEDLVGEVFVRALAPGANPPEPADGDAALRRYLNAVARHVVVDVARALRAAKRSGRELPLVRDDWSRAGVRERELASSLTGAATRLDRREQAERLVRAFARLAPDHRRVLGLRQFEGLSAAATARRMGRSETAVHSLYRRALAAWREATGPGPQ